MFSMDDTYKDHQPKEGTEMNGFRGVDTSRLEWFKTEIPASKAVSEKDKDIWNIKSLNFDMKPISRPSHVLDSFLKECDRKYEESLTSMNTYAKDINTRIENCIRAACERFKFTLEDAENTIKEWETLICSGKIPLTNVMMNKHEILNLHALDSLLERRKEAIENFHQELLSIENLRVRENICILRNTDEKLRNLAAKRPSEIRELLEMEILKINELVLNNVRYYEDIKLNLLLLGEKRRISFKDYVEKCHQNFVDNLLNSIQKKIEEINPEREFLSSDEGKKAIECLYVARNTISQLITQKSGHIRFSIEDVEAWSQKVTKAAEELDETAKMVISFYKRVTYSLFQGRITELHKLLDDYIRPRKPSDKRTILDDLQKRVFNPILEKDEEFKGKVSEIEAYWRELMSEMQNTLQGTFNFLYDSSKIWERHFLRTKQAKNMIAMKLIAAIAEHAVSEGELEKDLNIAIDSLRQEATEEKLRNTLHKVYGLLSEIEEQYGRNYTERQLTVEKYGNIIGAEIKVLQSEIEHFLNIYPNEYYNDYFIRRQEEVFIPKSEAEIANDLKFSEHSSLPQELKKCHYQTDALRNWKLGLREAIQFYHLVCDKEVKKNMKRWIDRQSSTITRNFEDKLAVLHARYHRVKTEIYDLRLNELESHLQRFESHVMGVQGQLIELTENSSNFHKHLTGDAMAEFNHLLKDLEEKGRNSKSTIEVSSAIVQAENMAAEFTYKLDTLLQDFRSEVGKKMDWIEKSNLNYIKNMKLFSDGGNFHLDEVQILAGELDKLTQDVETRGNSLRKHATEKETHMLRSIKVNSEKILQGLRCIYEDLHFAEKVTMAIVKVRDFIKKEVKHMKYNRKSLSSKIDSLLIKSPGNGGKDLLTFVNEFWWSLIGAVEQHCIYLLQPPSTGRNSGPAGLRFLGFEGIASGLTKKPILSKAPGSIIAKGYVELLFDNSNPPINGNSFMEKVCNCIWKIFLLLQEAAADFYKTRKGSYIRKDIVKPSLMDFIEETLIRFKYYHMQCEEVWVEEVDEYFTLLKSMKNAFNIVSEQSVLKFHTNRMDAVSAAHNLFVQKMEVLDRHHIDTRTILSKKLKPLHGYPGNSDILKDLTQEILNANSSMDEETKNHVSQYKDYLKERVEAYKFDVKSLSSTIEELYETAFVSPRLKENIAEQLRAVIEGIESRSYIPPALLTIGGSRKMKTSVNSDAKKNTRSRKEKEETRSVKEENAKEEIGVSDSRGTIEDKESTKVPPVFRLSIEKNDVTLNKTIRKHIKKVPTANSVDKKTSGEGIPHDSDENVSVEEESEESETTPCNVTAMLALAEEEFEDYVQKCDLMASKYVSSCQEEGKIWFKLFKKHAEKVKELYTVRHD